MNRRLPIFLFLLPTAAVVLLWLASGREALSKTGQWIRVQIVDDVWGEQATERWQPGPIFGRHIGLLDAVLPVAGGAAAVALGTWLVQRRRTLVRAPGGA